MDDINKNQHTSMVPDVRKDESMSTTSEFTVGLKFHTGHELADVRRSLINSVNQGLMFGELGHPRKQPYESTEIYFKRIMTVDYTKISHQITILDIGDDGSITGTYKLLDTPNGHSVQQYSIDNNLKFGVRGFKNNDNQLIDIITVDIINV